MNAPGQPARGDAADPQAPQLSPPEVPIPRAAGEALPGDPHDVDDDDEFEPL